MRVANLTVYDESASCQFFLPDVGHNTFKKLKQGSVLVVHNGATILDSKSRIILTLPSPKYSSIQVYNKQDEKLEETVDEYGDIVLGFCDDKTEEEIGEILLKNVSTIPLHINR